MLLQILFVFSIGSLGVLISKSKFESGKPKEPSLDEIVNGRSVSCRVFWLGRFSRFKGLVLLYTLLYVLQEEEDGAGEGVGDEVDTKLGSQAVVGLVAGPGW